MVLKNSRNIFFISARIAKNKEYARRGQEFDLLRIDVEINAVIRRSRMLAEELGARYAVFRCKAKEYSREPAGPSRDILMLSRETDRCIEEVHRLEQRRDELLELLSK